MHHTAKMHVGSGDGDGNISKVATGDSNVRVIVAEEDLRGCLTPGSEEIWEAFGLASFEVDGHTMLGESVDDERGSGAHKVKRTGASVAGGIDRAQGQVVDVHNVKAVTRRSTVNLSGPQSVVQYRKHAGCNQPAAKLSDDQHHE